MALRARKPFRGPFDRAAPKASNAARTATAAVLAALAAMPPAAADERVNAFDDPFIVVTEGLPGCPPPEGPLMTPDEARREAHWRAERGNSCFHAGRCRLSNAYLYDREIVPRVRRAVQAAGGFADTSVWAYGQRRWVWLQGCVSRAEQIPALEALVRGLDDVEAVVNELQMGTAVPTRYPAADPAADPTAKAPR